MKIGILTVHYNDNFGAVLQAVGLTEYLRSCGFDAEIIDYRPPLRLLSLQGLSWPKKIKRLIGFLLFFLPYKFSMRKFDKFRVEHLKTSKKIFLDHKDFPSDYDIYIIGSDQIWNKDILHHDVYKLYQGDFKRKTGSKLISYAASAGKGESSLDNPEFCKLIKQYDAISVRERTLQELLLQTFNINAQLVIDPTLLTDPQIWLSKVSPQKTKPYMLVYLVNNVLQANKIVRWAKKIAQQRGLEVKYIPSIHYIFGYQWYRFYSPKDFLNLVYNAECIITTSFHGCCFSIIYEKPFYFVSFGQKNENRIQTLLSFGNIQNRIVALNDNLDFKDIDYKKVHDDLKKLRLESRNFLHSNLS